MRPEHRSPAAGPRHVPRSAGCRRGTSRRRGVTSAVIIASIEASLGARAHSSNQDVILHHVALYVSDLEATRHFYRDVLGMAEIARPADFTFPGAYFRLGTAEVHVVVETEPGRTEKLRPRWSPEELMTGYTGHFALDLRDLGPTLARLAENGVPVAGGPRIRADNVEQWYITDPDGYVVELICHLDDAAAERRRRELAESGSGVPVAPGY